MPISIDEARDEFDAAFEEWKAADTAFNDEQAAAGVPWRDRKHMRSTPRLVAAGRARKAAYAAAGRTPEPERPLRGGPVLAH